MKHSLPTDVVNKVLNYLASKPFSEVSLLIREIRDTAVALPDTPVEIKESCEKSE